MPYINKKFLNMAKFHTHQFIFRQGKPTLCEAKMFQREVQ